MKSEEINIQEIIDNLPIVNETKNYWLIRTSSGNNYEEFIERNFIAIGWNEITLSDLHELNANPENKELANRIRAKVLIDSDSESSERGQKSTQSRVIAQLLKFTYEIKRGDIVIIPSSNSDLLAFGEVEATPLSLARPHEIISAGCSFIKRKRVNWIKKDISRHNLDSSLYRFIYSHQTVNNVNVYADHINSTLFDFYSKNGRSTLVLRVKKESNLDAFMLGTLYNDIIQVIREFSEFNGENVDVEDGLSVKFDLQSPGIIVLAGIFLTGLMCMGILTILAGGKFGIKYNPETKEFDGNLETNSLLDKISAYKNQSVDRRERLNRLCEGLQYFEVEENKNLRSLVEADVEESENNTTDQVIDRPVIEDGNN